MKRLALALGALGALGVIVFGALGGGTADAYQPVDRERFFADPYVNLPNADFDAVVQGCFPGEQVVFFNTGVTPNQSAVDTCDTVTFEARVTFQAPPDEGRYRLFAYLAAETSTNPDIPDRPFRLLRTTYLVDDDVVPVVPALNGGGGGGATFTSTAATGDRWPSFLGSAGFYRTFLALLVLLLGFFLVFLWRRRREEEEQADVYAPTSMPPPIPPASRLA